MDDRVGTRTEWIKQEIDKKTLVNEFYSNQALDCNEAIADNYDYICRLSKELAALQKPKYTAKDFPCLNTMVEDDIAQILYHDGTYEYEITKWRRYSTNKLGRAPAAWIDEFIDIIECKLSDIKVGDYFANATPGDKVSKYRYCTSFSDDYDGRYLYYDCGDTGYIRNARIPMDDIHSSEWEFVKFILKDK